MMRCGSASRNPTGPVLTVMMVRPGERSRRWGTPAAWGADGIDCGAGGDNRGEVVFAFGCGDGGEGGRGSAVDEGDESGVGGGGRGDGDG